jgi:hypothetical protein
MRKFLFGGFCLFEFVAAIIDILHVCVGSIILKQTNYSESPHAYNFILLHVVINALWKFVYFSKIVSLMYDEIKKYKKEIIDVGKIFVYARRNYYLIVRMILGLFIIIYGIVVLMFVTFDYNSPIIIFLIVSFCYEIIKNIFRILFLSAMVAFNTVYLEHF